MLSTENLGIFFLSLSLSLSPSLSHALGIGKWQQIYALLASLTLVNDEPSDLSASIAETQDGCEGRRKVGLLARGRAMRGQGFLNKAEPADWWAQGIPARALW